jgi:hypothetical protein
MRGVFKKMQILKTIVICKENSRTAQKRIGKRERGEQKIYIKKKNLTFTWLRTGKLSMSR